MNLGAKGKPLFQKKEGGLPTPKQPAFIVYLISLFTYPISH